MLQRQLPTENTGWPTSVTQLLANHNNHSNNLLRRSRHLRWWLPTGKQIRLLLRHGPVMLSISRQFAESLGTACRGSSNNVGRPAPLIMTHSPPSALSQPRPFSPPAATLWAVCCGTSKKFSSSPRHPAWEVQEPSHTESRPPASGLGAQRLNELGIARVTRALAPLLTGRSQPAVVSQGGAT